MFVRSEVDERFPNGGAKTSAHCSAAPIVSISPCAGFEPLMFVRPEVDERFPNGRAKPSARCSAAPRFDIPMRRV
jgi:hypothetical protein